MAWYLWRSRKGDHGGWNARSAWQVFRHFYAQAKVLPEAPVKTYRSGYLEHVDEETRPLLRAIIGKNYAEAPETDYREALQRTHQAANWIAAALKVHKVERVGAIQ